MSGKTETKTVKNGGKRALTPRLRFPEFREAPEWTEERLDNLGEVVTGKTPSTTASNLWGGGILFITPTDISEDGKYQHATARTVVETNSTRILPAGSVVYTCIASIGKMALTVHPSITNQQINTVVPNEKSSGEFIYYALASLTPWIKSIPASSTLAIINKTEFSKIAIPLPVEKAEQQRVAHCLTSADELIAVQARKVDALKTHKKGLMKQLFPREGETQPRLRFPELQDAGDWEESALEEIVSTITPPKKLQTTDNQSTGEFPIVDQSQAYICGWTNDREAVMAAESPVIVFGDHTCALKFIDRPFVQGADGIKIFKPKRQINARFLFYALEANPVTPESYKRHFSTLREKSISFPDPDSGEQQLIADCLTSLDDLIATENEKLDALKTHKRGLMQQLFPSMEEA